jgi:hypothetical protein
MLMGIVQSRQDHSRVKVYDDSIWPQILFNLGIRAYGRESAILNGNGLCPGIRVIDCIYPAIPIDSIGGQLSSLPGANTDQTGKSP